jgi:DNA-directed RNA polymerase omega subunit
MPSVDKLTKDGHSVYAVVVAAAKRARIINDWRLQRARVLFEEPSGPKATSQALDEIASDEVTISQPSKSK